MAEVDAIGEQYIAEPDEIKEQGGSTQSGSKQSGSSS